MSKTTQELSFQKYSALGNDYIVFAETEETRAFSPAEIAFLCDRRFGIGSDGVLIHQTEKVGDSYLFQIFNSDGSSSERSGNGLRIYAQWLIDNGKTKAWSFSVVCAAGPSEVQLNPEGSLTIEISPPYFDSKRMGIKDPQIQCQKYSLKTSLGELDVTSVSVGNPHTTVFSPVRAEDQKILGPEISEHPLFANGTNVQFVKSAHDQSLSIEIWERGSGMTLASGSSACAASAAAIERGLVRAPVTVSMPGGKLEVFFKNGVIWQTGRAQRVFSGKIDYPLLTAT